MALFLDFMIQHIVHCSIASTMISSDVVLCLCLQLIKLYLLLRLMELYGRTRLLLDVLRFFTTNGFNWSNDNTLRMYSDMSEHDRKVSAVLVASFVVINLITNPENIVAFIIIIFGVFFTLCIKAPEGFGNKKLAIGKYEE